MALLYCVVDTNDSSLPPHTVIVEDEIDASDPVHSAVRHAVNHIVDILRAERATVEVYGGESDEPDDDDHYRHQAHDLLGHRFRLFRLGKEVDRA